MAGIPAWRKIRKATSVFVFTDLILYWEWHQCLFGYSATICGICVFLQLAIRSSLMERWTWDFQHTMRVVRRAVRIKTRQALTSSHKCSCHTLPRPEVKPIPLDYFVLYSLGGDKRRGYLVLMMKQKNMPESCASLPTRVKELRQLREKKKS